MKALLQLLTVPPTVNNSFLIIIIHSAVGTATVASLVPGQPRRQRQELLGLESLCVRRGHFCSGVHPGRPPLGSAGAHGVELAEVCGAVPGLAVPGLPPGLGHSLWGQK